MADGLADRFGAHAGARLALVVGLITGVGSTVVVFGLVPGTDPHPFFGMNFSVYYAAAEAAVAGESFYDVTPAGYPGDDTFLYPPVVVVPFAPFLLVSRTTGFAAFTVLSVAAGVLAAVLVVRYLRAAGVAVGRLDAALVVGFVVASTHAIPTLYFGNVNLFLAAGVVAGFVALERGRCDASGWAVGDRRAEALAGVGFGLVALVKAFPAILGLWLLRARSVTATAAWAATGAAGLLAGVVVFGRETTRTYVLEVLLPRSDTTAFVGGLDPGGPFYVTLRRPLSHLIWWVAPDADPVWLTATTVAAGAAILAAFYVGLDTRRDRLAAMLATAAVTVTVVASFRLYLVLLYFPLLALLYTFRGPGYRTFLAGAVLVSVPLRPGDVLDGLAMAPGPVESALAPVLGAISLPLIGVLLLLAGCLRAKLAGWEAS